MEYLQKIKNASVRVAKQGVDVLKSVSTEVTAAASAADVFGGNESLRNNAATPRAQFVDSFQRACQLLSNVKASAEASGTRSTLSESDSETLRTYLRHMVMLLEMDDEKYLTRCGTAGMGTGAGAGAGAGGAGAGGVASPTAPGSAGSNRDRRASTTTSSSNEAAEARSGRSNTTQLTNSSLAREMIAELHVIKAFLSENVVRRLCVSFAVKDSPRGVMSITIGFLTTLLRRLSFPLLIYSSVSMSVAQLVTAAAHYYEYTAVVAPPAPSPTGASGEGSPRMAARLARKSWNNAVNEMVVDSTLEQYRAQLDIKLTALVTMIWRKIKDNPKLLQFFMATSAPAPAAAAASSDPPTAPSAATTSGGHVTSIDILTVLLPFVVSTAAMQTRSMRPTKLSAKFSSSMAAKEALIQALSLHNKDVDWFVLHGSSAGAGAGGGGRGPTRRRSSGTGTSIASAASAVTSDTGASPPSPVREGGSGGESEFVDTLMLDLHQSFQRAVGEMLVHQQKNQQQQQQILRAVASPGVTDSLTSASSPGLASPPPPSSMGLSTPSPLISPNAASTSSGSDAGASPPPTRRASLSAFLGSKVKAIATTVASGNSPVTLTSGGDGGSYSSPPPLQTMIAGGSSSSGAKRPQASSSAALSLPSSPSLASLPPMPSALLTESQVAHLHSFHCLMSEFSFLNVLIDISSSSTGMASSSSDGAPPLGVGVKDHFLARYKSLFLVSCVDDSMLNVASAVRLLFVYQLLGCMLFHLGKSSPRTEVIRQHSAFIRGGFSGDGSDAACGAVSADGGDGNRTLSPAHVSLHDVTVEHILQHPQLLASIVSKAGMPPSATTTVASSAAGASTQNSTTAAPSTEASASSLLPLCALQLLSRLLSSEHFQGEMFSLPQLMHLYAQMVGAATGVTTTAHANAPRAAGGTPSTSSTPSPPLSSPSPAAATGSDASEQGSLPTGAGAPKVQLPSISHSVLLDKLYQKLCPASTPAAPPGSSTNTASPSEAYEMSVTLRLMGRIYANTAASGAGAPHSTANDPVNTAEGSNVGVLSSLWELIERRLVRNFIHYGYHEQCAVISVLSDFMYAVLLALVRYSSADSTGEHAPRRGQQQSGLRGRGGRLSSPANANGASSCFSDKADSAPTTPASSCEGNAASETHRSDRDRACFVLVTALAKYHSVLDGVMKMVEKQIASPVQGATAAGGAAASRWTISNYEEKLAATKLLLCYDLCQGLNDGVGSPRGARAARGGPTNMLHTGQGAGAGGNVQLILQRATESFASIVRQTTSGYSGGIGGLGTTGTSAGGAAGAESTGGSTFSASQMSSTRTLAQRILSKEANPSVRKLLLTIILLQELLLQGRSYISVAHHLCRMSHVRGMDAGMYGVRGSGACTGKKQQQSQPAAAAPTPVLSTPLKASASRSRSDNTGVSTGVALSGVDGTGAPESASKQLRSQLFGTMHNLLSPQTEGLAASTAGVSADSASPIRGVSPLATRSGGARSKQSSQTWSSSGGGSAGGKGSRTKAKLSTLQRYYGGDEGGTDAGEGTAADKDVAVASIPASLVFNRDDGDNESESGSDGENSDSESSCSSVDSLAHWGEEGLLLPLNDVDGADEDEAVAQLRSILRRTQQLCAPSLPDAVSSMTPGGGGADGVLGTPPPVPPPSHVSTAATPGIAVSATTSSPGRVEAIQDDFLREFDIMQHCLDGILSETAAGKDASVKA